MPHYCMIAMSSPHPAPAALAARGRYDCRADAGGDPVQAGRLHTRAEEAERKCQPLRDLVPDTDFFAQD